MLEPWLIKERYWPRPAIFLQNMIPEAKPSLADYSVVGGGTTPKQVLNEIRLQAQIITIGLRYVVHLWTTSEPAPPSTLHTYGYDVVTGLLYCTAQPSTIITVEIDMVYMYRRRLISKICHRFERKPEACTLLSRHVCPTFAARTSCTTEELVYESYRENHAAPQRRKVCSEFVYYIRSNVARAAELPNADPSIRTGSKMCHRATPGKVSAVWQM